MTEERLAGFAHMATALRTRAAIRRSIPRGEPDRIANECDAAADALRDLIAEVRRLHEIVSGSDEWARL